ncbi:cellulose biosynthesis protein BcsP [Paraburkholderia phosphatilytica]|uniref:cellulose biosynthesis protein BcsP n=1 Tax=Paraburkholderia phosphatilytica TaxID=2282883 RepID=UPI000F5D8D5F|nr:cellulose biosynthesis protein BcsP [Paraburkholderia phosphatilytica]
MSNSSDIEGLYRQFGGNATDYQEIGRESDARTARSRWPLLVSMNLEQPSIPAIGETHRPGHAAQAHDGPGETRASSASSTPPPATRSSRQPLFALLSQRPPSPEPVKPVSGALGGARFAASPAEPVSIDVVPSAISTESIAAPLSPSVPPVLTAPAAAASPAPAPASMLRKLFTPPSLDDDNNSGSASETPLASVFARLRGDASVGRRANVTASDARSSDDTPRRDDPRRR